MISVKQFRSGDNLGYLIHGQREAIVIDGIAPNAILSFLAVHHLTLTVITNTHSHADHTAGNRRLIRETGARLLAAADMKDGQGLPLEGTSVLVYCTPGHSDDSVCFHAGRYLISGDTLFNGTVGNCFSGNIKAFYQSVKRLMTLPEDTVVYAGHDYVRDSMVYAATLEPDNMAVRRYLADYSPDHVFSTLKDELQINPFLRMNAPEITALLKKKGFPCETEWERWESLMTMD
jgi:hydroxyacylglutathione hydrolase